VSARVDWARELAWLTLGLLLVFHVQVFSGFALMQPDPGDVRLVGYLLEHSWQWLLGNPLHPGLWQAPFFAPAANTGAYADTVIGLLPLYVPWRVLGLAPERALQAFVITLFAANYGIARWALPRLLNVGASAAIAGAFVFAFAGLRAARFGHVQICGAFFVLLILVGLCAWLRADATSRSRSQALALIGLSGIGQLYSGFYVTWLTGYVLGWALILTLLVGPWRGRVHAAVRSSWPALSVLALAMALAAWPWLATYLEVRSAVGGRDWASVRDGLPRLESLVFSGRENALWGSFEWMRALGRGLPLAHEQRLFPGLVPTLVGLSGLWLARARPLVKLSAASVGLALFSALWIPGFNDSLWRAVYAFAPGADAIRVPARLALWLLWPLAVGCAIVVEQLERARHHAALAVLAALLITEQLTFSPRYAVADVEQSIAAIAKQISPECRAFWAQPSSPKRRYQSELDAMFAGLQVGVPTLNGYSGQVPGDWPLGSTEATPADAQRWFGAPVCVVDGGDPANQR
jgi:hypothetical protein